MRSPAKVLLFCCFCLWKSHNFAKAQGCFGGAQTFEKTTNFRLDPTNAEAKVLISQVTGAIVLDCLNLCRARNECNVVNMDYSLNQCVSVAVQDPSTKTSRLHERSAYFEKICLAGVTNLNTICGDRMWAFERVPGGLLRGFVEKTERNVRTRTDCAKLCLLETSFTCLSAQYNSADQTCSLSTQDRRSQKIAFSIDSERRIDYIENQCNIRSSTICEYETLRDLIIPNIEQESGASSEGDCRSQCEHADVFFCRSYSYIPERQACSLSADDSDSARARPLSMPGSFLGMRRCSPDPCTGGEVSFEKMTGFTLRNALREVLLSTIGGNSSMCLEKCRNNGPSCPAIIVDYSSSTCYKLDRNSLGRNQDLAAVEGGGQSYFEKVCLSGGRFQPRCRERNWMFERVLRHELLGSYDKVLDHVQNRRECEDACLREPNFECRSANYDYSTTQCILSRNDRRTLPNSFVHSQRQVDYLENQCVALHSQCQLQRTSSAIPRFVDLILRDVTTDVNCRDRCNTEKSFTCRAFSFQRPAMECLLSGDDRTSGGMAAIIPSDDTPYFERTCSPLPTTTTIITSETRDPNSFSSPPTPFPTDDHITFTSVTPTTVTSSQTSRPQHSGGRCAGNQGRTEYEKTTGYRLTEKLEALHDGKNQRGITAECVHKCDTDTECQAVVLDYSSNKCYGMHSDSSENRDFLQRGKSVAYFEALCYHSAKGCGKLWTFERFVGIQLQVKAKNIYMSISRSHCEEKCLLETSFQCRSINYNIVNFQCHLNSQDRVTDPSAIVESNTIDYLENQCARGYTFALNYTGNPPSRISFPSSLKTSNKPGDKFDHGYSEDDVSPRQSSRNCEFTNQLSSSFLSYVERAQPAAGVSECQSACSSEVQFTCRSYSFLNMGATNSQCFLSADTKNSLGAEMETLTGAVYAERYCLPEPALVTPRPIPSPRPIPPRPGPGPWPGPPPRPGPGIAVKPSSGKWPGSVAGPIPRPVPKPGFGPGPVPGLGPIPGPGPGRPNYLRPIPSYQFPAPPIPPLFGPLPPPAGLFPKPIGPPPLAATFNYPVPLPVPYSQSTFNPSAIIPTVATSDCQSLNDYTYERITGLENAEIGTPILVDLLSTPILDCLGECFRVGDICRMVTFRVYLDGLKSPCTGHGFSSEPGQINVISSTQSAVFQKICVPGKKCDKPWTFERVLYHGIDGKDDLTVRNVASREECASTCLQETTFQCRSLEYEHKSKECRLSRETRRTLPYSFRYLGEDVEYMENQCIPETTCGFLDFPNKFLPYFDRRLLGVPTLVDCREACKRQTEMNCRSISFDDRTKECFLSSCDRYCGFATVDRQFTVYAERLVCDEGSRDNAVGAYYDSNIPLIALESYFQDIDSSPIANLSCENVGFERTLGYSPERNTDYFTEIIPTSGNKGITQECVDECKLRCSRCQAFTLHYSSAHTAATCIAYTNFQERYQDGPHPSNYLPDYAFFKKQCFKNKLCPKLWTFDRIFGHELGEGYLKMHERVQFVGECEDLCLQEKDFICRSASFDSHQFICRLHPESKMTRPEIFRFVGNGIEYVENQCAPEI